MLSAKPNNILARTESHLFRDYPNQLLLVSGSLCYRRYRLGQRGGGVLVYVLDYIRSAEVINRPLGVWIHCRIGPKNDIVSRLY